MSTSSKRSVTTADSVEQKQLSDSTATMGDKQPTSSKLKHPTQQTSTRSTQQRSPLIVDYQAAPSPTAGGRYRSVDGPAARGKRRPGGGGGGVDRGSDSESRRRDERVRFAPDTVVQTGDGRAVIVDDSASSDRRPSRRTSTGGTLPARLRGHAAVRRTLPPEFEHQKDNAADVDRVARKSGPAPRGVQSRPMSAVLDDDGLRFASGGGSAAAVRTGSVPMSMNVLHRGNSAAAAAAAVAKSPRDMGAVPGVATRRAVDSNYYRDSTAAARLHRR